MEVALTLFGIHYLFNRERLTFHEFQHLKYVSIYHGKPQILMFSHKNSSLTAKKQTQNKMQNKDRPLPCHYWNQKAVLSFTDCGTESTILIVSFDSSIIHLLIVNMYMNK